MKIVIKNLIINMLSILIDKQYLILFGVKNCFSRYVYQKIFRINSHVPWLVHHTSVIGDPKMIIRKGKLPLPGFGPYQYFQTYNGIEIGENTRIALGVKIISGNHDIKDLSKHVKTSPVKIGKNCWLGTSSIILPNVELGDNVIVGAGSVVTKSFRDGNCVIAGNPARLIKYIS
jgi:acetyltransferase-like isoleucine patch superfamily enzyme